MIQFVLLDSDADDCGYRVYKKAQLKQGWRVTAMRV